MSIHAVRARRTSCRVEILINSINAKPARGWEGFYSQLILKRLRTFEISGDKNRNISVALSKNNFSFNSPVNV